MNRERIDTLEEAYLEEHPGSAGTVEPFVFDDPSVLENNEGGFPLPITTDLLLSEKWEETEQTWFVSTSGFGKDNEPALTADVFRRELVKYLREHPDHGFGLSSVGQFQVYVTAYRRVA